MGTRLGGHGDAVCRVCPQHLVPRAQTSSDLSNFGHGEIPRFGLRVGAARGPLLSGAGVLPRSRGQRGPALPSEQKELHLVKCQP